MAVYIIVDVIALLAIATAIITVVVRRHRHPEDPRDREDNSKVNVVGPIAGQTRR